VALFPVNAILLSTNCETFGVAPWDWFMPECSWWLSLVSLFLSKRTVAVSSTGGVRRGWGPGLHIRVYEIRRQSRNLFLSLKKRFIVHNLSTFLKIKRSTSLSTILLHTCCSLVSPPPVLQSTIPPILSVPLTHCKLYSSFRNGRACSASNISYELVCKNEAWRWMHFLVFVIFPVHRVVWIKPMTPSTLVHYQVGAGD
jgi:hypothetical protein